MIDEIKRQVACQTGVLLRRAHKLLLIPLVHATSVQDR